MIYNIRMEKFRNLMFFNIDRNESEIIDSWMSERDKKFLCMEEKGWWQTASDIAACLRYAKDGKLFNLFACINNTPAVAVMMGVEESGKVLRIYNLITNPDYRNKGLATEVMKRILKSDFFRVRTFNEIKVDEFKDNVYSLKILHHFNFQIRKSENNMLEFSKNIKECDQQLV